MKLKLLYLLIFLFTCHSSRGQVYYSKVVRGDQLPDEILRVLNNIPNRYEDLLKFTKSYFRSDPFITEFSGFMDHLLNDPDIKDKSIEQRTDTSLYSFYAVYSTYNPFFFTPKRIEILLQEQVLEHGDSIRVKDTLFSYQLMAFANDDAAGKADIKKEFEKIHRQNNKKFPGSGYDEIKDGDEIKTAMYNYFVPGSTLSPLSIMRGRIKDLNEWVLNITLRFKMRGNEAILATLKRP